MTDTDMSYTEEITVKDTKKGGQNVLNNSVINNVFLKDHKRAYIYKKAEKLSQAVHVILVHVQTSNKITNKLSELSMQLIGEVLHNQNKTAGSACMLEIISLLQVGETAGIIAPKNSELLIREYNYLLALSCEQNMQNVDLDTHVDEVREQAKTLSLKNKSVAKAPINSQGHKGHSSDRKGQVLEMLKNRGALGIKDIARVITDCSEKTIQRLLNTLIKEGLIKKEGERRWSTYHLIS